MEWTVPGGKLDDDSAYRYRVKADDRKGDGGAGLDGSGWSAWLNFTTDPDVAPATPTGLTVSPCSGGCPPWVTPSLNPELTATVADGDSDSLDVTFEVRPVVDGVPGPTYPQGEGSGGDLVAADEQTHTFDTPRFTIPSGVLEQGGTYEFRVGADDTTSTTYSGWTSFSVAAEAGPSLELAEPLVVWDHGPRLTWSAYRDAPDVTEDDLVEYQIFRGCLPGVADDEDCTPIDPGADFAAVVQDLELVATVTRDELSWTDESALSSAWGTGGGVDPAKYRYWVVARTLDDVDHHRDGTIASNPWNVQTPTEGRVRRIITGDTTTPDATLSSGQSTTTFDEVLRVGTAHTDGATNYGKQRAVVDFDLAPVGGRRIMSASVEVYQKGGGPAAATTPTQFDLHALTKNFLESQTTWEQAQNGVTWASPGGDYKSTALGSVQAAGGAGEQRLEFTDPGLAAEIRAWAADPTDQHGLLIKVADESPAAVQQWLDLTPSESTATDSAGMGTAPRLAVEHLIKTGGQTIEAPQVPQRFLPGTTETIPVTVTNTTGQTWPAGMNMRLSYRWTLPGQTDDQSGFQDDRYVALGRALQPGESQTVDLRLRTPINSDTGANRPEWDLYLDMYYTDSTGTDRWWSDDPAHAYTDGVVDAGERAQGLCEMVALGLLCPDRLIQSSPSSEIGLEESAAYAAEDTGAGSQALTNLHTGNLVWSYNAFANPSVGPSMFLRVSYNSLDTVATGAGFGWSVQPATLSRLGSRLTTGSGEDRVTLIDGDGTSHAWRRYADGVFRRPPGVALDLTSTGTAASGMWRFTRPDGTRFAYQRSSDNQIDGRALWVEDVSGQKLTFDYGNAADPDQLTGVTDAKGRPVATLDYYDNGKLRYVQDISGRTVQFTYDTNGKLVVLKDGGNYTSAADGVSPGTFAGPVKRFEFVYNTGSTSSNTRMTQITGPEGGVTAVDYWDTTESYNGQPVESFVNGWVESVTDRRGQTTVVDYRDHDGSDGKAIDATVDPEVDTGADPEITRYVVDSFGRATQITDPNENTTLLGWDSDHNVVRLTEPNGAVSRWQYDRGTGYPLKIWDAEAVENDTSPTVLDYGPFGRTTALTSITTPLGGLTPEDPNDYKTTFGYDTVGRLTSVTDPLDRETAYGYNADGTLQTVTDARGKVTTFAYGSPQVGYPTWITPPQNTGPAETPIAPTDFTYDPRGNVTHTVQTGAGQTLETDAVYDEFGRPTSITTPGAQGGPRTTTYSHDLNDNLLTSQAPNGAVMTSTYTVDDLLDTQTLPANTAPTGADRVVSYDYFLTGRLKSQTSPRGNVTDYAYDPAGQLLSVTQYDDTTPVTTSYEYDEAGNQISVVDPNTNAAGQGEKTTRLVYDLNHRVVTAIDALGHATRTDYDLDGQVVAEIDQRGNPTTYTYTPTGLRKTVTVEHTPLGEPNPQERTTTFDYDEVGNQTRVTRPSGLFEQTVFDANSRPVEQRSAFDQDDPHVAYRNPAATYLTYDALGRLKQQSAPTWDPTQKDWTAQTYWPSGEIQSSTDPWGIQTSYEYNKLGQQTKRTLTGTSGGESRVMAWDYHPDGSLHTRNDDVPNTTARRVDNADQPGFAADPDDDAFWATISPATDDGQVGDDYRTHAAAAAGSEGAEDTAAWTLTLPQTGQYRIQVSCPANAHLETGVGALTTSAAYTINVDGQNSSATLNQRTACPNQVWHTLTDTQVPGGAQVTVTLNPSADGAVVADAVRLISLNNSRTYTYSYDPDGNQTSITDDTTGARVAEYATGYDDLGRPTQVQELTDTSAVLRDTDYGYDLNGNVTSMTANRTPDPAAEGEDRANLAASRTTSYQWDARNLVTQLTTSTSGAGAERTWTYAYNPAGMLQTLTKPDTGGAAGAGNTVDYTYYEDGRLRTQRERTSTGDPVSSHQLWYTPDGDKAKDLSRVDNAATDPGASAFLNQTLTYRYTPTRKLEKVTKSARVDEGPVEEYTYDAAGNILEQTIGKTTTTNSYDRNRLLCSRVGGQPDCGQQLPSQADYSYDPFGRLTRTAGGGETVDYTYDGFDRLTRQVTTGPDGNPTTVDTGYDPLDRVTLQITDTGADTTRTRFGYLGLTEQVAIEERRDDTNGWQQVKTYAYGPDGQPVSLDSTPLSGDDKTRYYSYNPHGDVEALTDPTTGETTATYRYTAYGDTDDTGTTGEDAPTENPDPDADVLNPYRYSGHRYNGATDTYDFGFRNYDPGLNRFLTRDMYNGALSDMRLGLDPWNTNRYMLTGGNPTSFIDLDGHYPIDEDGNMIPPSEWQTSHGDFEGWPTEPGLDSGTSRYDRAIDYISKEMQENIGSQEVQTIRGLMGLYEGTTENEDVDCGTPCLPGSRGTGADAGIYKTQALVIWMAKTCTICEWNHKPKLESRLGLKASNNYYLQLPEGPRLERITTSSQICITDMLESLRVSTKTRCTEGRTSARLFRDRVTRVIPLVCRLAWTCMIAMAMTLRER